jgi:hypothetical protein
LGDFFMTKAKETAEQQVMKELMNRPPQAAPIVTSDKGVHWFEPQPRHPDICFYCRLTYDGHPGHYPKPAAVMPVEQQLS